MKNNSRTKKRESVPAERLMDAREAAEYLGVNDQVLYRWARQGRIPSIRLGILVRFDREGIEQWLAAGGSK